MLLFIHVTVKVGTLPFSASLLQAIMSAIRHAFKRSTIYFSRYGKVSAICCKCQHQQQRQFTGLPLTQLSEEELMIKDSGMDSKTYSSDQTYLYDSYAR